MAAPVSRKTSAITFGDLTPRNIKQLKVLNAKVLPVQYHDKYYEQLLTTPQLTQWAFYNDIFVGAISARSEDQGTKLYIMTLGVLTPYRRLGIASKLLNYIIEYAEKNPKITEIYLHVQTTNEVALKFYQKYNFEITSTVENYYNKIEEKDAHIITRKITHGPKETK